RLLNLNDIVSGAGMLLRTLVGEQIELRTILADDLRLVCVDRTQIEQVMFNLAVNARDAMPRGGTLTIETKNVDASELPSSLPRAPRAAVLMRLSDNGIDRGGATQARAFEPFFTTKASGRGSGLGLSTVHTIVTESAGAVALESEPGLGTSVSLWFPSIE